MYICMQIMNPFPVNNFFLYPLKSTENMWFFDLFRGYKRGAMWHGMENFLTCLLHVCNTTKIYQKNSSFYHLYKSHLKDSG